MHRCNTAMLQGWENAGMHEWEEKENSKDARMERKEGYSDAMLQYCSDAWLQEWEEKERIEECNAAGMH